MPNAWKEHPRFDIRFFRRELKIILKANGINDVTVAGWADFHKSMKKEELKNYCLSRALDRLYFFDLTADISDLKGALKPHKEFLETWSNSILVKNVNEISDSDKIRKIFEKRGLSSNIGGLAYKIVDHAARETLGTLEDLKNGNLWRVMYEQSNERGIDKSPARDWFKKFNSKVKKLSLVNI